MKYILIFLMVFNLGFGQVKHEKTNFKIIDQVLVWDHVFHDSISIDEVYKIIKSDNYFKNVEKTDNTISFETIEKNIEHKKYRENFNISMFMWHKKKYFCILEFKENRYKANVKNIEFIDETNLWTNFASSTNLERYALNNDKSKFKTLGTLSNSLITIQNYLLDKLKFSNKAISLNEDW